MARLAAVTVRRRSTATLALALAGVAALAVACGAASPQLTDRGFLSVAVTENGAPRELIRGTRIRLHFGPTDLGASAGCNSIGGTYRIDGGRLVFEGIAMTEMGCDPERHAQDDWLVAFLASRPLIRLAGNELILEGATTAIRLQDREVVEPDLNLVGPTWTVQSLITGDTVASPPEGAVASLRFHPDGSVDVSPGCNTGGGTWKLQGTGIELGPIALTKMACDGPGGELESFVLQVLSNGTLRASIDANVLTLEGDGVGLQLRGA